MTVVDRRYSVAEGRAVKSPCRAATTANITLSGEQTIDGVACVENDRVLVKDQTTASQNGVYDVSTGNWTRALDFDGAYDIVKGTRVWVHSGTVNGNMEFVVTTADPITVDSSDLTFSDIESLLNAAPGNADYLVKTANSTLTAERVVTDTDTVTWDFDTPGQAKANVPAATDALAGVVELATDAETIAGTDTTRAATPAGVAATIAAVSPALPLDHIARCTLSNNTSNATNGIDVAAGVCRDQTNSVNIVMPAIADKQLNADWAAGGGAGLRHSAAAIADGTYHLYAGRTAASETGDLYAYPGVAGTDPDSSAAIAAVLAAWQAETGGSAYAYIRRLGSILRVSDAIKPFKQYDDRFVVAQISDRSAALGVITAVTQTLSVPLGLEVEADICVNGVDGGVGNTFFLLSALAIADETPASDLANFTIPDAAAGAASLCIPTNSSGQIRVRGSDATQVIGIRTFGWKDRRGRA
jgi:hypothetical protein